MQNVLITFGIVKDRSIVNELSFISTNLSFVVKIIKTFEKKIYMPLSEAFSLINGRK